MGRWRIRPCDVVVVSQLALDFLTGCPYWLLTLVLQYVLWVIIASLPTLFDVLIVVL